jgi:uncharacterized protein YciI
MAARPAHVELGDRLRDAGHLLYGTAILDDSGKMIGSMLVAEYDTRQQLEEWLKIEPYVTGDVWRSIEIKPCKVGPSFVKK